MTTTEEKITAERATEETDAEIIARMHGDPELFATSVFDRYYAVIHGHVARRLGPDPADDVTAETFYGVRPVGALTTPPRRVPDPWLFGIASNLVAGHHRAEARRYRASARAERNEAGGADHADGVVGRIDAQAVRGNSRPLWTTSHRPTGRCCF